MTEGLSVGLLLNFFFFLSRILHLTLANNIIISLFAQKSK